MPVVGPSKPRMPIGISNYKELRREGYSYVDKTRYIADIIDAPGKSLLIPRPRRFGKTLGMSTLRYFFDASGEDYSDLFEDTWIWTADGGRYRQEHFGKHPVIYLTFRDIKPSSWRAAWKKIRHTVRLEMHRLIEEFGLHEAMKRNPEDINWFQAATEPNAEPEDLERFLPNVSRWLADATGQAPVILVDEYDAPLHAAFENGYWDEAVSFFRGFFGAGLKDTEGMFRGVLTGILRVAKENIFSGLNNLKVYTLVSQPFASDFGFTEQEVEELLERVGLADRLATVQDWYNGYRFGDVEPVTVYNPWSVINFIDEPGLGPRSFWSDTSDHALVRKAMLLHARSEAESIEALLQGQSVEVSFEQHVVLRYLQQDESVMWSLLLFSGYLTPEQARCDDEGGVWARLRVPNKEVRGVFRGMYRQMIGAKGAGGAARRLTEALLAGQPEEAEHYLRDVLENVMSYFDFAKGQRDERIVEAVYQAFIAGLLVHLSDTHAVRSNRESGYGRADVLVIPKQPGPGVVMELKVVDRRKGETPEQAAKSALKQVIDRDYAAELRQAGAEPVWQYGIVFDGKQCWVETV